MLATISLTIISTSSGTFYLDKIINKSICEINENDIWLICHPFILEFLAQYLHLMVNQDALMLL